MAFTLTDAAKDKQTLTIQNPSLIVEIDGYDFLFTMNKILKYTRVGDSGLYIDGTWTIGGTTYERNALDYISIDGTTSSISQQLLSDKGGSSSITSFQISLIDFNEKMTSLVSPGKVLTDILGRECFVYLGYEETLFPQDYVLLFNGFIDEVESGGTIKLNVANPESKKRQDIFAVIETSIVGAMTNSQTTIDLLSADNFFLPVTSILTTYVKIDNEIIKYTGITGNQLTGCVRGQFDTIAVVHDDATSAASWNRLQGNAIDLALQLMLSSPDVYYRTGISVTNFGQDGEGNANSNGIYFTNLDIETKWGLSVGDFITTTGASNGANNFSLRTVTSISSDVGGSFVIVNGAALVVETTSAATASLKSRYNVLPDGLSMGAHQVDVEEYLRIQDLFTSSIPDYDFYVTDTISGKEFIDKELLFPANLFSLPKKGKSSLGVVSPPLALATLATIDRNQITRPDSIKIKRSTGKYFYNTVVYKYNFDAIETTKPLTGYILTDQDSRTQIPYGTKAITIIGQGLRNDAGTQAILAVNARRLLEKYKYAAEAITLSVFYGIGFNIDVGDVVLFGDDDLNIPDSTKGSRGFTPRLCEVIDKKMDIMKGTVSLTVIDTSYLAAGRYGIFSPSSIVGTGSTTTNIIITDSYNTTAPEIEKNKWQEYIGLNIYIHDDTYSTTYSTKLLGFDPSDEYSMLIDPIGGSPTAGMIVDVAFYPSTAIASDNRILKNVFCFTDPSVAVTSGVSVTEFVVGGGDISKFLVGATIILHNVDWSSVSPEVKITGINTNNIVVDRTLAFTPSSSYTVELIGFIDGGSAYRYM